MAIVIPGYNEIDNVEPLMKEIQRVAFQNGNVVKFDVVFIDDGSKDGTYEKVVELSKSIKGITIHPLLNEENMGQGKSIMRGLKR